VFADNLVVASEEVLASVIIFDSLIVQSLFMHSINNAYYLFLNLGGSRLRPQGGGGFGGRPNVGGQTNINNNNVGGSGFGANINNNNVGATGGANINNNNVVGAFGGANINNNNVGGGFGGANINNNNVGGSALNINNNNI